MAPPCRPAAEEQSALVCVQAWEGVRGGDWVMPLKSMSKLSEDSLLFDMHLLSLSKPPCL